MFLPLLRKDVSFDEHLIHFVAISNMKRFFRLINQIMAEPTSTLPPLLNTYSEEAGEVHVSILSQTS